MIRREAEAERRTVSGYLLSILDRAVRLEESLFSKMVRYNALNRVLMRVPKIAPGPRAALLLRCSAEEADRIRRAARRREISISNFVIQAVRRVWTVKGKGGVV